MRLPWKWREKSRPSYVGHASFNCRTCVLHMQDVCPTYEGRDFAAHF